MINMKAYLAAFILSCVATPSSYGLAAAITSAEIGHSGDLGEEGRAKVSRILKFLQKELKFIEGGFINQFSNQTFGGTSAKTAELIRLMSSAGVWDVEVTFRDYGNQETAFTLGQVGGRKTTIVVNSGRKDFLLKDFAHLISTLSFPAVKVVEANPDEEQSKEKE